MTTIRMARNASPSSRRGAASPRRAPAPAAAADPRPASRGTAPGAAHRAFVDVVLEAEVVLRGREDRRVVLDGLVLGPSGAHAGPREAARLARVQVEVVLLRGRLLVAAAGTRHPVADAVETSAAGPGLAGRLVAEDVVEVGALVVVVGHAATATPAPPGGDRAVRGAEVGGRASRGDQVGEGGLEPPSSYEH
jgi:hypothetical protein